MKFDWKFFVTTGITIVGIILPVWIWQSDNKGRSISAVVVSSVALQPKAASSISDLKITIGGEIISSPSLSIVSISNDGSKSIPSSDFESPIEISTEKYSKVIRANIESQSPQNLGAKIDLREDKILIHPLLMNAGDSFTISIITDGDAPKFNFLARIAGISEITSQMADKGKLIWLYIGTLIVVAFMLFVQTTTLIDQVIFNRPIHFKKSFAVCLLISTGGVSGVLIGKIGIFMEYEESFSAMWPLFMGFAFSASFLRSYFLKKTNNNAE